MQKEGGASAERAKLPETVSDGRLRKLVAEWRKEGALPSQARWFDSKSKAADELEQALATAPPEQAAKKVEVCGLCGGFLEGNYCPACDATVDEDARDTAAPPEQDLGKCDRCLKIKNTVLVETGFASEHELLCGQCISEERAMADQPLAPQCPICGSYSLSCANGHFWAVPTEKQPQAVSAGALDAEQVRKATVESRYNEGKGSHQDLADHLNKAALVAKDQAESIPSTEWRRGFEVGKAGAAYGTTDCPICGKSEGHTHTELVNKGLPMALAIGSCAGLHHVAAVLGKMREEYEAAHDQKVRAEAFEEAAQHKYSHGRNGAQCSCGLQFEGRADTGWPEHIRSLAAPAASKPALKGEVK